MVRTMHIFKHSGYARQQQGDFSSQRGFALLEAMMSLVIAVVLIASFQTVLLGSVKASHANETELRAMIYLREMLEIARDLEQSNWAEFPVTCTGSSQEYHFEDIAGEWNITNGEEVLEGGAYTRRFVVEPVFRDQLDRPNQIVPDGAGGVCDESTKKVIATITWYNGVTSRTEVLEEYVYEYF